MSKLRQLAEWAATSFCRDDFLQSSRRKTFAHQFGGLAGYISLLMLLSGQARASVVTVADKSGLASDRSPVKVGHFNERPLIDGRLDEIGCRQGCSRIFARLSQPTSENIFYEANIYRIVKV
jgi:hypothetical protein